MVYYNKLYFTTENFTTRKVFFLQNLSHFKSFKHSKIDNLFILILLYVLEYE